MPHACKHEEEEILKVCFQLTCRRKSRFGCLQCIDGEPFHPACDQQKQFLSKEAITILSRVLTGLTKNHLNFLLKQNRNLHFVCKDVKKIIHTKNFQSEDDETISQLLKLFKFNGKSFNSTFVNYINSNYPQEFEEFIKENDQNEDDDTTDCQEQDREFEQEQNQQIHKFKIHKGCCKTQRSEVF